MSTINQDINQNAVKNNDISQKNDSSQKNDISDVKKAADNADAKAIQKNLQEKKSVEVPEDLTAEQKTPFIDETVRTDK